MGLSDQAAKIGVDVTSPGIGTIDDRLGCHASAPETDGNTNGNAAPIVRVWEVEKPGQCGFMKDRDDRSRCEVDALDNGMQDAASFFQWAIRQLLAQAGDRVPARGVRSVALYAAPGG